jgi:aldehyde dehydrogenase (NAD+)
LELAYESNRFKARASLANGPTCVLNPFEHTPAPAIVYADGPIVGTAMSRHSDVQMMSFTGSARAVIAVTQDKAPTVKRLTFLKLAIQIVLLESHRN